MLYFYKMPWKTVVISMDYLVCQQNVSQRSPSPGNPTSEITGNQKMQIWQ
jgi:hypothetical protein